MDVDDMLGPMAELPPVVGREMLRLQLNVHELPRANLQGRRPGGRVHSQPYRYRFRQPDASDAGGAAQAAAAARGQRAPLLAVAGNPVLGLA